jgi:hypothetical protein
MRDLLDYRTEFPILEETTYLVSHWLGPMPRQAAVRLGRLGTGVEAVEPTPSRR